MNYRTFKPKPNLSLYSPYFAEAFNEFAVSISSLRSVYTERDHGLAALAKKWSK